MRLEVCVSNVYSSDIKSILVNSTTENRSVY